MLLKIYKQNKWYVFGVFMFVMLGLSWITRNYLPYDQMLFNSLSEQLSVERIKEFTTTQKKWEWIGYLFIPLMLVIKWFLISVPIYVGNIFFEFKISYKKIVQLVMVSELIFLLLAVVKFVWFYYHKDSLTLAYIQFFMPLSLINLFEIDELDQWFVYPLQIVNLFEAVYWLFLSYFISKEIQKPFWKAFEFVLSTYGVGLLIWVIFVSFIVLNFS